MAIRAMKMHFHANRGIDGMEAVKLPSLFVTVSIISECAATERFSFHPFFGLPGSGDGIHAGLGCNQGKSFG
jgi:hypothetical protein